MKLIKSLNQSILYRVFEDNDRYYLVVTILNFFPFAPGPDRLLSEVDLWKCVAAELGKNGVLDQSMPKARGEVLIAGTCHAPPGKLVPAYQVEIHFGPLTKALYVFGDRFWKKAVGLFQTITDPVPFAEMPLTYANAFGGPDYEFNPLGKGRAEVMTETGEKVRPLPNIEDPDDLVTSPKDTPRPVGFGPLGLAWPQRMKKAGTYDEKWRNEKFPGLPPDIDPAFFNDAPDDQQLPGYIVGDEKFELKGMHPTLKSLSGSLPAIRSRCFINVRNGEKQEFKEIKTKADTAWLFPSAERGVLIHRGMVEIASDEAADVLHMIVAYERLEDPPRDQDHYRRALEKRLDPQAGALALIDERDLMPDGETPPILKLLEDGEKQAQQSPRRQNLMKKAQADLDKNREIMAGMGLDPDQYLPKTVPEPAKLNLEDLASPPAPGPPTGLLEQMTQKARETLAQLGLDYDAMVEDAKQKIGPRPVFKADEQIAALRAVGIESPEMEDQLRKAEVIGAEAYRKNAHLAPEPLLPPATEAARLRQAVIEARDQNQSLAGHDLLGADLSGLDLSAADFTGAFLEKVNLAGADLSGARLDDAVLARANLSQAKLVGASLIRTNLGAADLTQADLTEANLESAVLAQAVMAGAVFTAAVVTGADFLGADLAGADFSQAAIGKATFCENQLAGARFNQADLAGSVFMKCRMEQADFSGANLTSAVMVGAAAARTNFSGANLTKLCAVDGCDFQDADFQGADLTGAGLLAIDLAGANFKNACLTQASFYESRLPKANLSFASAVKARFDKANLERADMSNINLMEGSLLKARLVGANLSNSNLYGAELFRAVLGRTNFTGADLSMTKLENWRPE